MNFFLIWPKNLLASEGQVIMLNIFKISVPTVFVAIVGELRTKGSINLNWIFQRARRVQTSKPINRGVRIFLRTKRCKISLLKSELKMATSLC